MGVYRSDQAQLTFAAEAAQGGDPEMIEGNRNGTSSSGPSPTLSGAHSAGSRTITLSAEFTALKNGAGTAILAAEALDDSETAVDVDANHAITAGRIIKADNEEMLVTGVSTNTLTVTRGHNGTTAATHSDDVALTTKFLPGDFIRIGTIAGTAANTTIEHEVRRVESQSGTSVVLDRPTAFHHANAEEIFPVVALGGDSTRNDNDKFLTFIPGIYETIDTPDPEMSIEGRRFLSTQSKRNFSVAYSGQQSLTGSVSGIILLNGWALRFPIGSVTTTPSSTATDTILLDGAANKGDVYITCNGANVSNLDAGDHIQIIEADGTKSEVRKIITDTSDTFKLNYPLQFDHADDAVINEVSSGATYTHVIEEQVDLDTVSWHVHMKDSTETDAKDFDRRYVGGMVGSSTIAAEEGGMVTMSWDGVSFLNMVHNQQNQKTVGAASGDDYFGANVAANMPRFGLMQAIDSDDVGAPSHNAASPNNGTGYPNNQPYYFSEGTIKFFGQEFARIRSFSLSIANNEEPRYYLGKQGSRARGPYEIKEGPRDYAMSASVVLPDADVNANATAANASQDSALELFRQLLLEGDYGAGGAALHKRGFTATIKFERGTNDSIIIDIPGSTTAGSPTTTTSQLNSQGIFINSAPHSITGDNPFQVDLDMIFRSLKITIEDSEPVYP